MRARLIYIYYFEVFPFTAFMAILIFFSVEFKFSTSAAAVWDNWVLRDSSFACLGLASYFLPREFAQLRAMAKLGLAISFLDLINCTLFKSEAWKGLDLKLDSASTNWSGRVLDIVRRINSRTSAEANKPRTEVSSIGEWLDSMAEKMIKMEEENSGAKRDNYVMQAMLVKLLEGNRVDTGAFLRGLEVAEEDKRLEEGKGGVEKEGKEDGKGSHAWRHKGEGDQTSWKMTKTTVAMKAARRPCCWRYRPKLARRPRRSLTRLPRAARRNMRTTSMMMG